MAATTVAYFATANAINNDIDDDTGVAGANATTGAAEGTYTSSSALASHSLEPGDRVT